MILTNERPDSWKDLQNRVAEILMQCGFLTEIEKVTETARGKAELDVYAEELIKGRKYSIVCECKYWKANIPQNVVHGFRTVVSDLGCNIGYIITTSDFQSGAVNTSEFTNVQLLTWDEFCSNFFESWYESYFSPVITERLDPLLTYTEPLLPRWFDKMSDQDKEAYFLLKQKYDVFGWIIMSFTPYGKIIGVSEIPSLPLVERIKDYKEAIDNVPIEILEETGYKEFFEKCILYGDTAIAEFRQFRNKYGGTISDE